MGSPSNLYEGRWRWWYSAIADYMLAHPGAKLQEIAAYCGGKNVNTISMIMNTDMFKAYYEDRKAEYEVGATFEIRQKLNRTMNKSLDVLLEQLETKGATIPMNQTLAIVDRATTALGLNAKEAGVNVNVTQNNNKTQNVTISGVSLEQIQEAREAMRRVQEASRLEPMQTKMVPPPAPDGPQLDGEFDDLLVPAQRRD